MHPPTSSRPRNYENNFTLLRFIAATLVLFSHSWPLALGPEAIDPLQRLIGVNFGAIAVCGFFSISGYLVAGSWDRRPALIPFAMARAARIVPGLLVVLLLTALVLGAIVTTLPPSTYFSQPETWTYVLRNVTLAKLQWSIPNVFGGAKLNGSLWTLPYEVACYCLMVGLAQCGLLKDFAIPAIVLMVLATLGHVAFVESLPYHLATFWMSFSAGICLWKWPMPLKGGAVVVVVVAAALAQRLSLPLSYVLVTHAVALSSLYLALVPAGFVRRFNRFGDYSYGIYIYAWPVQTVIHHLWPNSGVLGMFALAFPVTFFFAVLSWRFVESPALEWAKHRRRQPPTRVPAFGATSW